MTPTSSSQSQLAAPVGRVRLLDALRFASALAVVLYHYGYTYGWDRSGGPWYVTLNRVSQFGYLGVEVFFMISGFVILWSAQGRSPLGFARSRVLRLYPEFWLAIPISFIVFKSIPGGMGDTLTIRAALANLTMVAPWLGQPYVDGVYWTLLVELKFYLIVFFLILTKQVSNAQLLCGLWIILSVVAIHEATPRVLRTVLIYPYGIFFAAGCVCCLIYRHGPNQGRLFLGLACIPGIAYETIQEMDGFVHPADINLVSQVITAGIVVSVFLVMLVFSVTKKQIPLPKLVVPLAALTYPLYLLHNVGKEVFLHPGYGLPLPIAMVLAFTLAMALAILVNRVAAHMVVPALRRRWPSPSHPPGAIQPTGKTPAR